MAVRKFSEIAISATPKIIDYVVGVTSGNADQRFPIGNLIPAIPASGNMDFYVSTTGSDANSGTSPGSPFATIQHALNASARFDYLGTFNPIIHVADGTYNVGPIGAGAAPITLPQLISANGPGIITGNAATPTNVIIWDNGGFGPIFSATSGPSSNWDIGGVTLDEEFQVILIGQGSTLQIGDSIQGAVHFRDRTGNTFQSVISLNGDGGLILVNFSVTFDGTNLGQLIFNNVGGPAQIFWNAAINFKPASTWGAASSVDTGVIVEQQTTAFSNPPSGGGLGMNFNCSFIYRAGTSHFIFGDGGVTGDPSCLTANTDGFGGIFGVQTSGLPSTTTIPIPGTGNFHKDTSGGGVYAAYNDSGTIKKVQLT